MFNKSISQGVALCCCDALSGLNLKTTVPLLQSIHILPVFISALLLLSGCISIPTTHYTMEQIGSICATNTECLCEDSVLPGNFLDVTSRADGLNPEQITLLNWNSHKETGQPWLRELQRLIQDVDLLTLQEGAMGDGLRNLLEENYGGNWTLASAFTQSDIHTGVLTASRIAPDFACSYRIEEPIIVVPKTVLITRYPIAGTNQSLLLVNLHLVNFSLITETYRKQLAKALDLIRQHQGPLLIAGDFNSWSNGRQVIMQNFADELHTDAVRFSPDQRITFRGQPLDHVFYRGLELIQAESRQVTVSDHNPMRITFRVTDPFPIWSSSNE